jgi:hypothetical protein
LPKAHELLENRLVDKAPDPILTRFDGLHHGVAGGVKVFGSVFVFGGIAAADMAAFETSTQVNPRVAHL